jgi:hypothetical protein
MPKTTAEYKEIKIPPDKKNQRHILQWIILDPGPQALKFWSIRLFFMQAAYLFAREQKTKNQSKSRMNCSWRRVHTARVRVYENK